jgi:protein phosphatase-4 regulatory subunit 3
MRIILDTDMMGDHGPMGAGFADEAEGIPPGGGHNPPHEQHCNPSGSLTSTTDQNQFLSMFYDHYVQWLSAPFLYTILHPVRRAPNSILHGHSDSPLMQATIGRFEKGDCQDDPMLLMVPLCAIRSSFAVELLSFCVRAHLYRMKCYMLRSRVLGSVLKLLKPSTLARNTSGDRCLKLASLR